MLAKFMQACYDGNIPLIIELINQIDVNQQLHGETALYHAASQNKLSVINILLIHKANPNLLNQYNTSSPLLIAAAKGYIDVVKTLLDNGSNPNICDYHNTTPLHYCAANGNADITFLLLKFQANPNLIDDRFETPLHKVIRREANFTSVSSQFNETIKWLIIAGASPYTVKNKKGEIPYDLAQTRNDQIDIDKIFEEVKVINQLVNKKPVLTLQFNQINIDNVLNKTQNQDQKNMSITKKLIRSITQ